MFTENNSEDSITHFDFLPNYYLTIYEINTSRNGKNKSKIFRSS